MDTPRFYVWILFDSMGAIQCVASNIDRARRHAEFALNFDPDGWTNLHDAANVGDLFHSFEGAVIERYAVEGVEQMTLPWADENPT